MKVHVIPFEEYNERVKSGASKCEYISLQILDEGFHFLKLENEIFVPHSFAEKILELTFGSP